MNRFIANEMFQMNSLNTISVGDRFYALEKFNSYLICILAAPNEYLKRRPQTDPNSISTLSKSRNENLKPCNKE